MSRDVAFAVCDVGVLVLSVLHLWRLYRAERSAPVVIRQHLQIAGGAALALLLFYRIFLL